MRVRIVTFVWYLRLELMSVVQCYILPETRLIVQMGMKTPSLKRDNYETVFNSIYWIDMCVLCVCVRAFRFSSIEFILKWMTTQATANKIDKLCAMHTAVIARNDYTVRNVSNCIDFGFEWIFLNTPFRMINGWYTLILFIEISAHGCKTIRYTKTICVRVWIRGAFWICAKSSVLIN